jgi:hypothetical protein
MVYSYQLDGLGGEAITVWVTEVVDREISRRSFLNQALEAFGAADRWFRGPLGIGIGVKERTIQSRGRWDILVNIPR